MYLSFPEGYWLTAERVRLPWPRSLVRWNCQFLFFFPLIIGREADIQQQTNIQTVFVRTNPPSLPPCSLLLQKDAAQYSFQMKTVCKCQRVHRRKRDPPGSPLEPWDAFRVSVDLKGSLRTARKQSINTEWANRGPEQVRWECCSTCRPALTV